MQCGGHQRTINLPILQTTGAFVVLSRAACQLSISHFANDNWMAGIDAKLLAFRKLPSALQTIADYKATLERS